MLPVATRYYWVKLWCNFCQTTSIASRKHGKKDNRLHSRYKPIAIGTTKVLSTNQAKDCYASRQYYGWKKLTKLKCLYDGKNNREYLVSYDERDKAEWADTSQVAETHIDIIINAPHKKKQKVQWTRKGAHNAFQIRVSNGNRSG